MWIYATFILLLTEAWSLDPGLNIKPFFFLHVRVVLVHNILCHDEIQLSDTKHHLKNLNVIVMIYNCFACRAVITMWFIAVRLL